MTVVVVVVVIEQYIRAVNEDLYSVPQEYLLRQGNAECNPQRFLESRGDKDKLQVIIRNEDIASEIHKVRL